MPRGNALKELRNRKYYFHNLKQGRNHLEKHDIPHHGFELPENLDRIILNPLTTIVKNQATNLYTHPFVKQYILMRLRKDCIHVMLYVNVILFAALLTCLTGFAIQVEGIGQLNKEKDTWYNVSDFITELDSEACPQWHKTVHKNGTISFDYTTYSACFNFRIAATFFTIVRLLSIGFDSFYLPAKYHDQAYSDGAFEFEDWLFSKLIHVVETLIYLFTLNPYFGVLALLHSWLYMPSQLIRLHGGTNVIIMRKVFQTAFSILHLLLIFCGAVASILHIGMLRGVKYRFKYSR